MDKDSRSLKILTVLLVSFFIFFNNIMPTYALDSLSKEEKAYIEGSGVIKAGSMGGAAPISYRDSKGNIQGIGKRILEEISEITGLIFEYELYDTKDEFTDSKAHIFFGISKTFASDDITLSKPFLKSETILFTNSELDSSQLENKIYAMTASDKLPQGVKKENIKYYQTREETIDAVETGEADYGYGNAYSLAFYTLQNGYKNIITIPRGHSSREYCMGVVGDDILLSIINKSLDSLGDNQIQNIILDATSRVERKITPRMIMATYGIRIVLVFILIIAILIILLISNYRTRERFKLLSQTDGLTGLYNAITIRELIATNIKTKDNEIFDAFIIMDCDKFKDINDSYGHLVGDQVLGNVSKTLRLVFNKNAIIGRVGGDEFCVYIKDVPSQDFVLTQCEPFNKILQIINRDFHISVSIGALVFKEQTQFKNIFKEADDALYEAKKMGHGQLVVKSL